MPLYVSAQQHKFIGGALLNINGIEFKGNTALYWNSSSGTIRIDGTLGFSAGLFVKREFSKHLYSTLELRYSNNGSIYEFTSLYGTQSFESVNLNYIEIPVLLGYRIKYNKKNYFLETGLAFGKMISSNLNKNDLTVRAGTPNEKDFKKMDIS